MDVNRRGHEVGNPYRSLAGQRSCAALRMTKRDGLLVEMYWGHFAALNSSVARNCTPLSNRCHSFQPPLKLTAEYISPKNRLGTVASNRVPVNPFRPANASHVLLESG